MQWPENSKPPVGKLLSLERKHLFLDRENMETLATSLDTGWIICETFMSVADRVTINKQTFQFTNALYWSQAEEGV